MRSTLLSALIFFTSFGSLYAGDSLYANVSDSLVKSHDLDEVVVQAFKPNTNLSVKPVSATEISAQIIKEREVIGVKDISGYVPNLFIPDYGSKMISPVFIRGIGSRTNAPSVGLYVDGVPYFDRSSFDFDINGVDRIEVLRGPQGTIYGRNTMGGIINVYTKSTFKYKETNINLSAGSYDSYKVGVSRYDSFNDKFGYSVSANYSTSGGYFDNITTGKSANPVDAIASRIRLSYKYSQRLSFHLTSAYEYSDQDGYPYALYNSETNRVGEINYNSPSYYRRNMSTTGFVAEYAADHFKVSSQSSFQYFDGKQGLDQDFTAANLYYVNYWEKQRMFSQEFNLKSVEDSRYQWQFGLFGFYQGLDSSSDVNNFTADNHKIQDVETPAKGFAAYHQSTINDLLIKNLALSLGVRYDWEKEKAQNTVSYRYGAADPVQTEFFKDKDHFSQVTPKVSLLYSPAKDKMVYSSISKGYKSGGFNSTAQREEDYSYKPEYSWNYEIGSKISFFNNLIQTDAALFYISWRDQQISQSQPDGKGYILRNAGKSESKGAELTLTVNPLSDLRFDINYGYTHAKFKKYERDEQTNYNDKYLPMIPSNTFSLSGNYGLKVKKGWWVDKVSFNAQYKGIGKLYWKEDNDVSQPFYGTVDGKISFQKKNVSLDFWMKNIGNTKYIAYYFYTSKGYAQEGRPFTCGVNVSLTLK